MICAVKRIFCLCYKYFEHQIRNTKKKILYMGSIDQLWANRYLCVLWQYINDPFILTYVQYFEFLILCMTDFIDEYNVLVKINKDLSICCFVVLRN